ncbi:MAG: lytic transglycosylase domain-containing protein [Thermoanaerobacteraceae bacterium]|nr:lytic transglycosylase domain-containing protein [Thermoanaerobacteraceae bacterium]
MVPKSHVKQQGKFNSWRNNKGPGVEKMRLLKRFYQLFMKFIAVLLIAVAAVHLVLVNMDFHSYEEAAIRFLARQEPAKFALSGSGNWFGELGHVPGESGVKVEPDIEKTFEYKMEQWTAFKRDVSDTLSLLLNVWRLERTEAGEEYVNPVYAKSWLEIARDNLSAAAAALYRMITVRVMRVGDQPVMVVKKKVLPYDHTDKILRWAPLIEQAARKYGVDPAIVAAVMEQESGGDPRAVSPAGAIGLMQLMPATARFLGVDPYDPVENIEGGTRYLAMQLKEFGNLEQALAAYNAGPGNVYNSRYLYISETKNYIRRVPELIEKYREKLAVEAMTAK